MKTLNTSQALPSVQPAFTIGTSGQCLEVFMAEISSSVPPQQISACEYHYSLSLPSRTSFSQPLNPKGKVVAVLNYTSRCEGTDRGAGSASVINWELDGGE
jgi:hypothetical protein